MKNFTIFACLFIVLALFTGCGSDHDSDTEIITEIIIIEKVGAPYATMSKFVVSDAENKKYALGTDGRVDSNGDSIAISMETQKVTTLVRKTISNGNLEIKAVIGNYAVTEVTENYPSSNRYDLYVSDPITGDEILNANSSNHYERFLCLINNGDKMLYTTQDTSTWRYKIYSFDSVTQQSEDLFLTDPTEKVMDIEFKLDQKLIVFTMNGVNENKVYSIDTSTGIPVEILNCSDVTDALYPYEVSMPETTVYVLDNTLNIGFHKTSDTDHTNDRVFVVPDAINNNYEPTHISSDGKWSIIEERNYSTNDREYYIFDIENGTQVVLNLSGYPGIEVREIVPGNGIGAYVTFECETSNDDLVLFANAATGIVTDLVDSMLPTGAVLQYSHISRNAFGKSIVMIAHEINNSWYENTYISNGTALVDLFNDTTYRYEWVRRSNNQHVVFNAYRNDGSDEIVYYNMEDGTKIIVATSTNGFGDIVLSENSTHILFGTEQDDSEFGPGDTKVVETGWTTAYGTSGINSNLFYSDANGNGRWNSSGTDNNGDPYTGEDIWIDDITSNGLYDEGETQVNDGGDGWQTTDGTVGIQNLLYFHDTDGGNDYDTGEEIWCARASTKSILNVYDIINDSTSQNVYDITFEDVLGLTQNNDYFRIHGNLSHKNELVTIDGTETYEICRD